MQSNRDDELNAINKPLENVQAKFDFAPGDSVFVLQNEYALTSAQADKTVLGTIGAGPCFILAIHDAKNHIAFLAHLDTSSSLKSLESSMQNLSKQHCLAHIYGGEDNKNYALEIIDFLNKHRIQIVNAEILRNKSAEPTSLAIDAKSGEIYSHIKAEQLDYNSQTQQRFKDYATNEEKRSTASKERVSQVIAANKHLWGDKNKMDQLMSQAQKSPVDEVYNGTRVRHKLSSFWGRITSALTTGKNESKVTSEKHVPRKK